MLSADLNELANFANCLSRLSISFLKASAPGNSNAASSLFNIVVALFYALNEASESSRSKSKASSSSSAASSSLLFFFINAN